MRKNIYLDYNATTPLAAEVYDAIVNSLKNDWANPSSSYESGERAKKEIEIARQSVAEMLSTSSNNIIFTSGGTEANNLVIHSAVQHYKNLKTADSLPHIVTSNIEHDAIKLPLQSLKSSGDIDLTVLPVSKITGIPLLADVVGSLRLNTCLVTLMLANNETGVLMPIEDMCRAVKNWSAKNKEHMCSDILFHTDAAQAIGKIPINVASLGIDYLTVVGHKFYGPRIGALYVSGLGRETPLCAQMLGGGQERGYRAGTENTPMIVGLGKASELVTKNLTEFTRHLNAMKNYFEEKLEETFHDKLTINNRFPLTDKLPNTVNLSFIGKGLEGYAVLSKSKFIMASVGAACHSHNKPSAILLASGIDEEAAKNAIRFSFGRETTKEQIDEAILDLLEAYNLLKINKT